MAGRASEAKSPDPFTPPPRPPPEICAEAGFTGIERRTVRAGFAIRDPLHFWDWSMSPGFRGYGAQDVGGYRDLDRTRRRALGGLSGAP